MKKTCAWISRHDPLRDQKANLADYRIVKINPPGRLWSAADAIVLSQNACGGWPDLFVVVMPVIMLQHFITLVDGRVPIVRGVYDRRKSHFEWTGRWEQVKAVNIVTQAWSPGRKECT